MRINRKMNLWAKITVHVRLWGRAHVKILVHPVRFSLSFQRLLVWLSSGLQRRCYFQWTISKRSRSCNEKYSTCVHSLKTISSIFTLQVVVTTGSLCSAVLRRYFSLLRFSHSNTRYRLKQIGAVVCVCVCLSPYQCIIILKSPPLCSCAFITAIALKFVSLPLCVCVCVTVTVHTCLYWGHCVFKLVSLPLCTRACVAVTMCWARTLLNTWLQAAAALARSHPHLMSHAINFHGVTPAIFNDNNPVAPAVSSMSLYPRN